MSATTALPPAGRLQILRQRLVAIPEQMGQTLARVACSTNIKERRDHSCALFDAAGRLLAQAAHIPVHLGSMADSLAAARSRFTFAPGDAVLLNDPFEGGTHLPDITLITPIFEDETLVAFAASRAHHSDVGGPTPGSMGAARSIFGEGVRIPPIKWFDGGRENDAVRTLLLANVRTPTERLGDLRAQRAAHEVGHRALLALRRRYADTASSENAAALDALIEQLLDYAQRMMQAVITAIPDGCYSATDFLEGDGVTDHDIAIRATITISGDTALIDFDGTALQVAGCVNCPLPVTRAAVMYVFACLADDALPHNDGMYRPITITAPRGCVVNAEHPAAVAAGNVETSQRIVDVLLAALSQAIPARIPAASAGTMSGIALGGTDPRSGRPFSYYETIAGGSGAMRGFAGESAIQTHMTNTRNTPVEALESACPVRVRSVRVRTGSGGGAVAVRAANESAAKGSGNAIAGGDAAAGCDAKARANATPDGTADSGVSTGGDGMIREIEALAPMRGALLADRRRRGPPGNKNQSANSHRAELNGCPGLAQICRATGETITLPSKCEFELQAGDVLRIETPGGGGWEP